MKNKIKTFTLQPEGSPCKLICDNVKGLFENLQPELENVDIEDDGEAIEYIIRIERKLTQDDISKLHEFDGF